MDCVRYESYVSEFTCNTQADLDETGKDSTSIVSMCK